MTGTTAAPLAGQADHDFSLRRARRDIEEGCVPIHDFVVRFLLSNKGGNPSLADYLNRKAKTWLGPIEVNLENIERITGPGKEYHEPEERWETRVKRIETKLKDLEQLPPLIAGLKDSIDGTSNQPGILKLVDGAHRLEAIKRLGFNTAWLFVFFDDSVSRYNFLTEYNAGIYNIHYKRIDPDTYLAAHPPAVPGAPATAQPASPRPAKPEGPPKLHSHYASRYAERYDQARESQPHWHTEYQAVAQLLQSLPEARILDAPFGTGRFIPIYHEMGCKVFGADISHDMLKQADLKARRLKLAHIEMIQGDIATLDLPEVDAAVCVRFLNLVPPEVARSVIHNLARASRRELILHLGSVDEAAVPPEQLSAVLHSLDHAHDVQRSDMKYAPHKWSSILEWCGSAGFHPAESIETQTTGSSYSRVHIHRMVRRETSQLSGEASDGTAA